MFWTIFKHLTNPVSFVRVGVLNYCFLVLLAGYYFVVSKITPHTPKKYFFYKFRDNQILVDSNFSDIATFIEIFAFNEYATLLNLISLRKSYNIIDLGANIGLFHRLLDLKRVNIAQYIAVEPNTANFQALYFNIFPRTSVIAKALWVHDEGVWFSTGDHNHANRVSSNGDIFVPTITLKDVLSQIDNKHPTILKMDIEGAEYDILKCSSEFIGNIALICIEFHNVSSESVLYDYINHHLTEFECILEKKSSDMYLLTGKLRDGNVERV